MRVVRTYGMSETCGGCVYDGVPLDGVELRIDDGGQVLVRGPVLFDGYADPDATARVLRDGWFATADLGEIVDGRLRDHGRSDDVVISGGVNIALPAVTRALRGLEAVRDAVALGVPDAEWGARVVAYVVPADAVCLDGLRLDELRDAVEEAGLPRTWAPARGRPARRAAAAARRQARPAQAPRPLTWVGGASASRITREVDAGTAHRGVDASAPPPPGRGR